MLLASESEFKKIQFKCWVRRKWNWEHIHHFEMITWNRFQKRVEISSKAKSIGSRKFDCSEHLSAWKKEPEIKEEAKMNSYKKSEAVSIHSCVRTLFLIHQFREIRMTFQFSSITSYHIWSWLEICEMWRCSESVLCASLKCTRRSASLFSQSSCLVSSWTYK